MKSAGIWRWIERHGTHRGLRAVRFWRCGGELAGFDKNPAKTIGIDGGVWYNTKLIGGYMRHRLEYGAVEPGRRRDPAALE